MITRYNEFLNPKKPVALMEKKEYFAHIDGIQTHIDVMILEGRTKEEINEGLGEIFSALGGGFKKTLYQYAAGWVLGKLGLPKEGWIMELATQIVSEIEFTSIGNYFGDGSCKYWAEAIQHGLVNFITNEGANLILGSLKIAPSNPAQRGGISNTFIKTIANSIGMSLINSDFLSKIEAEIEGKICGKGAPGFSDIFKGKTADPAAKQEMKDQLHQASKDDPSVIGQAKGMGLLSFLGIGGGSGATNTSKPTTPSAPTDGNEG